LLLYFFGATVITLDRLSPISLNLNTRYFASEAQAT